MVVRFGIGLAAVAGLSLAAWQVLRSRDDNGVREQRRVLADAIPNMAWAAMGDGTIEYANVRVAEFAGAPLAPGTGWRALLHVDDESPAQAAFAAAVNAGSDFRLEARLRRSDGMYRWHEIHAVPVHDDAGSVVRWFGSAMDIQIRKESERLLSLLSASTEALSASLDPRIVARQLAAMVAPSDATYCEIGIADERGTPFVTVAGDVAAFGPELRAKADAVFQVRDALLSPELSVVPVLLGSERAGWIICCGIPESLQSLVPELAHRLSGVLANARAFDREHRVATTFQEAALDRMLPAVPGMRFDALYQAAGSEATVGGDWYDVFRLPDGRVIFSIGDVAGSGLHAAVTMASVRQSIRTAVLINPSPAAVLDAVDRIVRAMGEAPFVTAFVGVLDPVFGELTYANAGHPPPFLRDAAGTITPLTQGDLPLGVRQRASVDAPPIAVTPGTTILAYTDGLTEIERDAVRGHDLVLATLGGAEPPQSARAVFDAVSAEAVLRDDVAILVIWVDELLVDGDRSAHAYRWSFSAASAEEATAARHDFVERLQADGFEGMNVMEAEMVFGELIGNVMRHTAAPHDVEVILDASGPAHVLHVLDRGSGFELQPRLPADPFSERGRGLFLVNELTDEFSIQRRAGGGSHVRAVLAGTKRISSPNTLVRNTL